jgi:hypothetical protein
MLNLVLQISVSFRVCALVSNRCRFDGDWSRHGGPGKWKNASPGQHSLRQGN